MRQKQLIFTNYNKIFCDVLNIDDFLAILYKKRDQILIDPFGLFEYFQILLLYSR